MKTQKKYNKEKIFLIKGKGSSTGIIPSQERMIKEKAKGQKTQIIFFVFLYWRFFFLILRVLELK